MVEGEYPNQGEGARAKVEVAPHDTNPPIIAA